MSTESDQRRRLWNSVRVIWARLPVAHRGHQISVARQLSILLNVSYKMVKASGLDRVQSEEAWFARLAEMRRGKHDKRHDRFKRPGRVEILLAAVSQDYMCEPVMLKRTGLTVADHQRLTIERYDALLRCDTGVYILPVLQGYTPDEYVDHIRQYGSRLARNAWVGVGSICKRNSSPCLILDVLIAIKTERPDLRLHGFGLKTTALGHGTIRKLLETADSMAWSFAARRKKTGQNDWRNAAKFKKAVERHPFYQSHLIELTI